MQLAGDPGMVASRDEGSRRDFRLHPAGKPPSRDIDDRICIAVEHLANFPQMGRSGRVPGTRELVITRTPYIAVYQITGETIRIERVLHGAQQLPS